MGNSESEYSSAHDGGATNEAKPLGTAATTGVNDGVRISEVLAQIRLLPNCSGLQRIQSCYEEMVAMLCPPELATINRDHTNSDHSCKSTLLACIDNILLKHPRITSVLSSLLNRPSLRYHQLLEATEQKYTDNSTVFPEFKVIDNSQTPRFSFGNSEINVSCFRDTALDPCGKQPKKYK